MTKAQIEYIVETILNDKLDEYTPLLNNFSIVISKNETSGFIKPEALKLYNLSYKWFFIICYIMLLPVDYYSSILIGLFNSKNNMSKFQQKIIDFILKKTYNINERKELKWY